MTDQNNKDIALAIIGLFAIAFAGVFTLIALGRDLGAVGLYIVPSMVTLAGVLAAILRVNSVEKKTDEQTGKIDEIHANVNGKLDAKFKAMHDEIAGLSNQVRLANGLNEKKENGNA